MMCGSFYLWLLPAMFSFLLCSVAALAEFRLGDVVPMSYKTEQILSTADEVGVCMPRVPGELFVLYTSMCTLLT